MPAPDCRCLIVAVLLACAAASASAAASAVNQASPRYGRKLFFDPIQTCKNQAETCTNAFLPLFQQCCGGQNLTCWRGPTLDTTRCVKRPQPPSVTVLSSPGNWTFIIKPRGLPASIARSCSGLPVSSQTQYVNLMGKDPWAPTYRTDSPPSGNNSACLNGPLQLTIDEPTCTYRYLKTKACAEGSGGCNATATIFQGTEYLHRLFTIKPAPGHSGPLVGAGTSVNIVGAGRVAGGCAAVNLASASTTCTGPGLVQHHVHRPGPGAAPRAQARAWCSTTCTGPGLVQSANAVARPSQWVLESAGKPGLVYIRSVARTIVNCPARYLGVSKATCGMAYDQFKYGAASLFVKNSPGARTIWRLERA
ncbi:hypothetical protein ABPG75_003548 [Micractinium tetrahymenae]